MPSRRATASAVVRLSPVSMTTRMPSAFRAASASGVEALTGSAMAKTAAGAPVDAHEDRGRAVLTQPVRRRRPAQRRRCRARAGSPALPSTTGALRPCRARPCRPASRNPSTGARAMPRACAARTIASASGCSLARSTLAARRSMSASAKPCAGTIAVTAGRPSVSVPVLSTTSVSTFSMRSSASAFLMRTPACAPRPTPTMIDIGVASPSAHGQAMISTATAATRP